MGHHLSALPTAADPSAVRSRAAALNESDRRQLDRALIVTDLIAISSAIQLPAARTGGAAPSDTGSLRPASLKRHPARHPRRQPP